ncbi:MAG: PTS sugar transporter subunit IIB [Metamycoplasmataceae bacterium]
MKILLACSAGMSTSLLEASIKKYAESIGHPIDVIALPSNEAKSKIKDYDIVLLGPQVKFMEQAFKDAAGNIPVVVIPPAVYAMAKGEACFNLAKDNLK